MHAPRPICHAGQKPPPCARGVTLRRNISALTGPGGQATDHPRINPFRRVALATASIIVRFAKAARGQARSHPAFCSRLFVSRPNGEKAREIFVHGRRLKTRDKFAGESSREKIACTILLRGTLRSP